MILKQKFNYHIMKTRTPAACDAMQKCRDLLRRKHYALTTEQVYCQHIGSYIDWLLAHRETIGRLSESGDKVKAFLTAMAGETVRWRMHEVNVQRAVKKAAESLGLDGLATPHVLRHCCATHILDAGGNVRDVQDLLGHASLNTTMIYIHGNGERVRSPLDTLADLPANVVPFTKAA